MQRHRRNIFHRDDSIGLYTGVLRRDTSRDDCRNSYCRDGSRDDHRNLLRRDVSRDECRTFFHRYINIDGSTCTTMEMSLWRRCKISSRINTNRDVCRYKVVLTVSCRY